MLTVCSHERQEPNTRLAPPLVPGGLVACHGVPRVQEQGKPPGQATEDVPSCWQINGNLRFVRLAWRAGLSDAIGVAEVVIGAVGLVAAVLIYRWQRHRKGLGVAVLTDRPLLMTPSPFAVSVHHAAALAGVTRDSIYL
jgi:hypothetical protein